MNNCCENLRIRSKKYKRYLYCVKAKKVIDFENCKCCAFKKYKKYKKKIDTVINSSIMPDEIILISNSNKIIRCFNHKINGYHKHHIFEGRNRNNSEKYGLYTWIKWEDHVLNKDSFHENPELIKKLHKIAKFQFQKTFPELDFIEIFGQNF